MLQQNAENDLNSG